MSDYSVFLSDHNPAEVTIKQKPKEEKYCRFYNDRFIKKRKPEDSRYRKLMENVWTPIVPNPILFDFWLSIFSAVLNKWTLSEKIQVTILFSEVIQEPISFMFTHDLIAIFLNCSQSILIDQMKKFIRSRTILYIGIVDQACRPQVA